MNDNYTPSRKSNKRHSQRTPKPKKGIYDLESSEDEPEIDELEDEEDLDSPTHGGPPRRSLRKRYRSREELDDAGKKRKLHVKAFRDVSGLCSQLLHNLMKNQHAWPFNVPVDPVLLELPDYFQKITHPMDFGTIKKKLAEGFYLDSEDYAADVRLVFSNCKSYNEATTDIALMANTLSRLFEEQYALIKQKETRVIENYEIADMKDEINRLTAEYSKLQQDLHRLQNGIPDTPKAAPKPKIPRSNSKASAPSTQIKKQSLRNGNNKKPRSAAAPIARPLVHYDFKMKELLGHKIEALNPDNLQKMVQYISSELSHSNPSSNGEVEIDLEDMNDQTLNKLEDFVAGCLKEQTGPAGSTDPSLNKEDSNLDNDAKNDSDNSDSDSSSSDSESEDEKDQNSVQ